MGLPKGANRASATVASSLTSVIQRRNENLLKDVISDDVYFTLFDMGLLNEKNVRDHHIYNLFQEFKPKKSVGEVIEKIQMEYYPYLEFDTIRKIVYQTNGKRK